MRSVSETLPRVTDLTTSSQADLARGIGVSPQTISLWRTARRLPHPANLRALAAWLQRRAEQIASCADMVSALAAELEDPARREAMAKEIQRRDVPDGPSTARVRGGPPQLRVRKGCLKWLTRWSKRRS